MRLSLDGIMSEQYADTVFLNVSPLFADIVSMCLLRASIGNTPNPLRAA